MILTTHDDAGAKAGGGHANADSLATTAAPCGRSLANQSTERQERAHATSASDERMGNGAGRGTTHLRTGGTDMLRATLIATPIALLLTLNPTGATDARAQCPTGCETVDSCTDDGYSSCSVEC